MKTCAFSLLFVLCAALSAVADLGVDREELKKGKEVEFINYTGPYDTVNTFEQIRGIGVYLGKNHTIASHRSTYLGRYSIIHVYDPADKSGRFDADIFVIEASGFIDHIRNVRTVIAGYLQTAYGYPLEDARLLARFITLYNAVFRGNVAYFQKVYKAKVTEHLSAADAGLALVYSEWPGKTKVLIPLSEGFEKGKLSSLDTQQLTEEEVKDALRREEDKGIEDRKKLVELEDKALEEKKKDLKDDKKTLEDEKKKLEDEKKKLEEEKKSGDTKAAKDREEEIKRKEDEIKKSETDIARREDKIDKAEDRLRTDRDEIAKDERGLAETTVATADTVSAEKGLFLTVRDGEENEAGEVVLYSFKDGRVLARSQGLRVKERRLHVYDNLPLVVAEAAGKPGAFLMFLDIKTLAVTKQSQEEVFKNTVVMTQGTALYAVVKKGNQYFVGKFDTGLALAARSADEVNPHTPLTVFGPYLYVQAKSGLILRLNINDLTAKDTAGVR